MRTSNWTLTSEYPQSDVPVTFTLRPLNQRMLYELQRARDAKGVASFEGAAEAFRYGVVGWQGIQSASVPLEFSDEAKTKVLSGTGDPEWMVWLIEIANELYRAAFLTEAERKNS